MVSPETEASTVAHADIQAIGRIGQILALFTNDSTFITAGEVAKALGLNRTTAHRYLTSMAAEDLLLARTDPPGYRLGSLPLRLGGLAIGKQRVTAIASEPMARLAEEAGTNISLSVWTPSGPMVAATREPSGHHVILTFQVGTLLPINTAQGAVFLAFGRDREEMEAAIASLPEPERSVTRAKVTEVRRTGLATAVTETTGTCGLAAPIFDGSGVCAALAIVDAIGALNSSVFPRRLVLLQEAAQHLTVRLGGAAPGA